MVNIIAFGVPFFLLFMGVEYWYSRKKGYKIFQFSESIANINVGIAERLLDVFTTGLFFYVFDYVYRHFAIFPIKSGWITWFLLFLATDFVWYWYHRFAHEINLFWAVHVVHHQSEDFNFTVSARITVFQAIVRSMFWCVLPLLGFPPVMVSVLLLIHGVYPFFVHTRTLGKWYWFEKVLVTPTHHGVHHASNPEYLDKNYGDVLIIWDKLFGTFVEEKAQIKPVYGLTTPLNSHSFLWQHFHFFLELFMAVRHSKGWKARMHVLLGKPDTVDPRYRRLLERRLVNVRPFKVTTPVMRHYVTIQTALSLLLLFIMSLFIRYLSTLEAGLISAFLLMSVINSGAILDQRRWIFYLEISRLAVLLVAIAAEFRNSYTFAIVTLLLIVILLHWRLLKNFYIRALYQQQIVQSGNPS